MGKETSVVLEPWTGPSTADAPDANVKADVALAALVDPFASDRARGRALDRPVGARCRDVLAKWVAAGNSGLMALRASMTWGLADACDRAEAQGTDDARIVASSPRRGMPSWARPPADHADLSRRRVIDGE